MDRHRTELDPELANRIRSQQEGTDEPSSRTELDPGLPEQVKAAQGEAEQAGARLTPGERIAQYELIRPLGEGGMGQVFLARDTKLGRLVAIKFLHRSGPAFTERFLSEARTTAQCTSENIVVIHEVNELQGRPYMVLEYLEGEPLSGLIRDRQLPATRAVELMVPVVRALVRAHEFNIIHRDLKPDNIFVQTTGVIKVLDFGIAKLFSPDQPAQGVSAPTVLPKGNLGLTREGALVGTLPYMSPEQFGVDTVDHRTDLWAAGIILFEMVAGEHPLAGRTPDQLMANAGLLDRPMTRVADVVPDLPGDLERIIDRCLAKRKEERFQSARELLDALEPLLPGRFGRQLDTDESPFPGLTAFQESDADRFFGRSPDIIRAVARIREQPLTAVVGPSGVGKSSFIRAGVIPALKRSGEAWEIFVTRPGRTPLASLASLLQPVTRSSSTDLATAAEEHQALMDRLQSEPGYLGTLLRSRARQKGASILLFVDQFEELYTLTQDPTQRAAFTACLAGMADDASAPLRVVLSMRSDFLDRAAGDQRFMEEVTRGLVFLQPPDRDGLSEAVTQPVELAGHRFESPALVDEMLDALEQTPGALPLLQFTATKLWEARDRKRQVLTRESYEAMGGIAGALASHANEVLSALDPASQRLVREIFLRLVTAEGTRAQVDAQELHELAGSPQDIQRLVDYLVGARLLVVQTRGDEEGTSVEVVHESLISGWPTLRHWLDETREDTVFLEQLRNTARQWSSRNRPAGLLWRGEAMQEARRWYRRYPGTLPRLEKEYLDAVLALATRSRRRRRVAIIGAFVFLLALVAAGAVALLLIRDAERKATHQAVTARKEATRAREAEDQIKQQIQVIRDQERAKQRAEHTASKAKAQVVTKDRKLKATETKLDLSYHELKDAYKTVQQEKRRAQLEARKARAASREARTAADRERKARHSLKILLDQKKAEIRALKRRQKALIRKLR